MDGAKNVPAKQRQPHTAFAHLSAVQPNSCQAVMHQAHCSSTTSLQSPSLEGRGWPVSDPVAALMPWADTLVLMPM